MVSIIIPNYNNGKYLMDCVDSCFRGAVVLEVIIVDDNSTDNSPFILDEIRTKYPSVQIIELEDNAGVSNARNVGIRESSGEFIITLDADDMIIYDSIEKRIELFLEREDLDVIYGPMLKVHGNISYGESIKNIKKWELHPSEYTAPMYRRRVFSKFGLFHKDLRSKEDKEFSYRLGVHRKSQLKDLVKFVRVDFPVYIYRRHENAKRKKRARDLMFDIETCMEFDKRMKQLEVSGITKDNTEFL